jgi:hypothetical protein
MVRFSNVFDCYADAVFVNLPASAAGNLTFTVHIYAYDKAAFDAENANGVLAVAAENPATDGTGIADSNFVPGAGFTPTWTTSCVATQQSNIVVLAVCAPLAPFSNVADAGVVEAGADASMLDAGPADANVSDANVNDASVNDANTIDAQPMDAGIDAPADAALPPMDAAMVDAPSDAPSSG